MCGRCLERQARAASPDAVLFDWLRAELVANLAGRRVRLGRTSCLDICPGDGVVVLDGELGKSAVLRLTIVCGPSDRENLLQSLLTALDRGHDVR